MTSPIPVKLTSEECELLDWLMNESGLLSRSAVLRSAMLDLARRHSAPQFLMHKVMLARLTAVPRASRSAARRRRTGS